MGAETHNSDHQAADARLERVLSGRRASTSAAQHPCRGSLLVAGGGGRRSTSPQQTQTTAATARGATGASLPLSSKASRRQSVSPQPTAGASLSSQPIKSSGTTCATRQQTASPDLDLLPPMPSPWRGATAPAAATTRRWSPLPSAPHRHHGQQQQPPATAAGAASGGSLGAWCPPPIIPSFLSPPGTAAPGAAPGRLEPEVFVRPGPLKLDNSAYFGWAHGDGGLNWTDTAIGMGAADNQGLFEAAGDGVQQHRRQQLELEPQGRPGSQAPCVGSALHKRPGSAVAEGGAERTGWLRSNFPGARPPGREDAESLQLWLKQQLGALQQQEGLPQTLVGDTAPGGCESGPVAAGQLLPGAPADADGLEDAPVLQRHAVLTAAFGELCRQISVGCAERGRLMAWCWAAGTALLRAALFAAAAARGAAAEAQAGEAVARADAVAARTRGVEEATALRAMMERHSARAAEATREAGVWAEKHAAACEQLERLAEAQRLARRVDELEASNGELSDDLVRVSDALDKATSELEAARAARSEAERRAAAAEAEAEDLGARLGGCTPRPRRDMGLLGDLLSPEELKVVESALVAGVPAEQVHRLLLGLTQAGVDVSWWEELLGCCRAALDAHAYPAARAELRTRVAELLSACDVPGLAAMVAPRPLATLSKAVHLGLDHRALLQLMDGTMGFPRDPDCSPYASVLGVLCRRYRHDASELGGAVTAALAHAALPTRGRMEELTERSKALHRELVMCKRALADQRKHEAERIEAALRDQQRQMMRRSARPLSLLDRFLQTKWGDYFTGIGTSEELPRVLRCSAPINNKRMPKREAEKLTREVWAARDEAEARLEGTGAVRVPLSEYLWTFLERRYFAIPRLIIEIAYNLIYSLGQHSYDADCHLFLRIFAGDVEERVRTEQATLEGEVLAALRLVDVSVNHQATGWLHKTDVKTALAGFFGGAKKVDRLDEIFEALDTDEPGDMVAYLRLFEDDSDMNQSMFAETIRGQCLAERLEYLQELEDVIRDYAEDNAATDLTPSMLAAALKRAHKGTLDGATVNDYVMRAFGPGWRAKESSALMSLSAIIKAIRRGGSGAAAAGGGAGGIGKADAPAGGRQQQSAAAGKGQQQQQQGAGGGGAAGPPGAARRRSAANRSGGGGAMRSTDGSPRRRRSTAALEDSVSGSGGGKDANGRRDSAAGRSRRETIEAVAAAAGSRRVTGTRGGGGRPPSALPSGEQASGDCGGAVAADGGAAGGVEGRGETDAKVLVQRALTFSRSRRAGAGSIASSGLGSGGWAAPAGASGDGQALPREPSSITGSDAGGVSISGAAPAADGAAVEAQLAAAGEETPSTLQWRRPAALALGGLGDAGTSAGPAAPLSPAVLSAMRAVRQAWAQEERSRSGGGGSGGGAGAPSGLSYASGPGASSHWGDGFGSGGGGGGGSRFPSGAGGFGSSGGGGGGGGSMIAPVAKAAAMTAAAAAPSSSPRVPPLKLRFAEQTQTAAAAPGVATSAADSGQRSGSSRGGNGSSRSGSSGGGTATPTARSALKKAPSAAAGDASARGAIIIGGASARDSPAASARSAASASAVAEAAPTAEEGGKRTAAAFRKLSKRGSLWRLEGVIMHVEEALAGSPRGADGAAEWAACAGGGEGEAAAGGSVTLVEGSGAPEAPRSARRPAPWD